MTLDMRGVKVGYLQVIEKAGRIYSSGSYRTLWKCKCLCGKETTKRLQDLRSGKIESCGCCEWHIKHNESYVSWMGMKQRCNYPNAKGYEYYGGRGIKYDPRWEKFEEFYIDMGDPPKDWKGERLSLDRVDTNKDYSKENCKWSDRSEQQFNKR